MGRSLAMGCNPTTASARRQGHTPWIKKFSLHSIAPGAKQAMVAKERDVMAEVSESSGVRVLSATIIASMHIVQVTGASRDDPQK